MNETIDLHVGGSVRIPAGALQTRRSGPTHEVAA